MTRLSSLASYRLPRHSNKAERTIVKLIFQGVGVVVLLIVVIVLGYRFFESWQAKRLLGHAERYLDSGDTKSAAIMARHVLEVNSSNARACRILARISERVGQPAAIDWRMKVLETNPDSSEDTIALAKTALQFNEIATAETALEKVKAAARLSASYQEARAQLALAKKDPVAAEKYFAQAVRTEPSNRTYQFNLATAQLQSNSPDVRAAACALLRQFMEDNEFRISAAHALRDHAVHEKDVPTLLETARSLRSYPEATFRDRLSYVQILHALNHPDFAGALTDVQNEAATDSSKVTELLSWLSADHLAMLGIEWAKQLSGEVARKGGVRAATADCYLAANDWNGLQQVLKNTNWGDLEFLRHAYLARAFRERGDTLDFRAEWNVAMQEAGSDGERIFALEQGAAKWGWKSEVENLLWMLSKDAERQTSALGALYRYYADQGDTGGLYRVVARLREIRPGDEKAQNNFAQLSLLLSLNLEHAHQVAEQLYRKDPTNSIFAATYAFSLYRKGQYAQAAMVMGKLEPAQLEDPGSAVYYGLFLVAAGDKSKAAEYLKKGSEARLLPEEKTLLQNAWGKINGNSP